MITTRLRAAGRGNRDACRAARGIRGPDRRAVIRDEALRLFARHGPEAVSLRRVAVTTRTC